MKHYFKATKQVKEKKTRCVFLKLAKSGTYFNVCSSSIMTKKWKAVLADDVSDLTSKWLEA